MLTVLSITLLFPVIVFLPGRLFAQRLTSDSAERFAFAWGIGIAVLAASQFIAFALGADPGIFNVAFWVGAVVLGMIVFRRSPSGVAPSRSRDPLLFGIWGLTYLHLVVLQCLLPIYAGDRWYGDWYLHYEVTNVFLGHVDLHAVWLGSDTVASRTPVFNLAAGFLLSLVRGGFPAFQVAATLLSSTLVSGIYVLLRGLFGRRTAAATALLAGLNVWFLHNGWFTWPKLLTCFYLVMALHFYLKFVETRDSSPERASRSLLWAGVWSICGFFTHPLAGAYMAAVLVHLALLSIRDRRWGVRWRDLTILIAVAGCTVVAWYGWLITRFGIGGVLESNPLTVMNAARIFTWGERFHIAFHDIGYSLYPKAVVETIRGTPTWAGAYRGLTIFYFTLVPGAVTLSVIAALPWLTVRLTRDRRLRRRLFPPARADAWTAILVFVFLGGLAVALLHPLKSTHGIAHAVMVPSTVVTVVLLWGMLYRASRRAAAWAFRGAILESVIVLWSYLFLLRTGAVFAADGNWEIKRAEGLTFLADRLGGWTPAVVVLAAAILGMMVALLWIRFVDPGRSWRLLPSSCR